MQPEPTDLQVAAPFLIAIILLVIGAAAARVARVRFLGDTAKYVHEARAAFAAAGTQFSLTPELEPDNLTDYLDWTSDVVAAATALIPPVAGVLLLNPSRSSAVTSIAYVATFGATVCLLVWVAAYRDIGEWARKSRGWFTPVTTIGIAVNTAAGAAALIAR